MATGMFGANPEELDAVGNEFGTAGGTVTVAETTSGSAVQGVIWFGVDATLFKADYQATVCTQLSMLSGVLEEVDGRLQQQAQDQTDASQAGGSGGGGFLNNLFNKLFNGVVNALKGIWGGYRNIYKPILALVKAPRTALELLTMATQWNKLGLDWLNGWRPGNGVKFWDWAKHTGAGGLEDAAKALKFPFGYTYQSFRALGDTLQGNWKAGILNVFGNDAQIFKSAVDALPQGARDVLAKFPSTGPSQWLESGLNKVGIGQDAIESFTGKAGRGLGKGLGVVDFAVNGVETVGALNNGDYKSAAWNGAQTVLAAGSFVPGPVGVVCAAGSIGMTVYENREAIGNAISTGFDNVSKGKWPWG